MTLMDTAGQEKFRAITSSYFRGSDLCIIVYDITDSKSFFNISDHIDEARKYVSQEYPIILLGNKVDLVEKRVVDLDAANDFAKQQQIKYFETSAKERTNIVEVMDYIADFLLVNIICSIIIVKLCNN